MAHDTADAADIDRSADTADAADARARDLHRQSLVIDTLAPWWPEQGFYSEPMLKRLDELVARQARPWEAAVELAQMAYHALLAGDHPEFWRAWDQAGVDVVSLTMGVFGPEPFSYKSAVRDIAQWVRLFDELPLVEKITSADDIERVKATGKRGVILNFQNSTHLDGDLANLEVFYNLGVRIILLTYNSRNLAGDGCTERRPSGLSHFGAALVREMNDMGVLVDLAHCSDQTTLDAIESSEKPVAITHSCAKAVTPHDRAKGDDVLRALGERGGYFGQCLVPFFISDEPRSTLDHWLRHLEHVIDLVGIDHVGIGTDWGAEVPPAMQDMLAEEVARLGFRDEHRVDWSAQVEGFETWRTWPNITRALVSAGYSDDEIRGFLGANFLRVFRQTVG